MSISNHILSDMIDIIRIRSESDQKYENKYDIGDIRPYPIRFHPYSWATACMPVASRAGADLFFF